MRSNKNKSVVVRLTEQEHSQVKQFTVKEGVSISDLFRLTVLKTIQHYGAEKN